jgi:hypothetical protein
MRTTIVLLQAATYIALTVILLKEREWKLAGAQFLLAIVTWLVYA